MSRIDTTMAYTDALVRFEPKETKTKVWLTALFLAGLVIMALLLRIWRFVESGEIDEDEAFFLGRSMMLLNRSSILGWIAVLETDYGLGVLAANALNYLLLKGFGLPITERLIQLPSVFFGGATILGAYAAFNALTERRSVGLITASLLAVIPSQVVQSRSIAGNWMAATCLLYWSLFALAQYAKSASTRWAFASGVALALYLQTDGMQVVVLAYVPFLFLLLRPSHETSLSNLERRLLLGLGFLVILGSALFYPEILRFWVGNAKLGRVNPDFLIRVETYATVFMIAGAMMVCLAVIKGWPFGPPTALIPSRWEGIKTGTPCGGCKSPSLESAAGTVKNSKPAAPTSPGLPGEAAAVNLRLKLKKVGVMFERMAHPLFCLPVFLSFAMNVAVAWSTFRLFGAPSGVLGHSLVKKTGLGFYLQDYFQDVLEILGWPILIFIMIGLLPAILASLQSRHIAAVSIWCLLSNLPWMFFVPPSSTGRAWYMLTCTTAWVGFGAIGVTALCDRFIPAPAGKETEGSLVRLNPATVLITLFTIIATLPFTISQVTQKSILGITMPYKNGSNLPSQGVREAFDYFVRSARTNETVFTDKHLWTARFYLHIKSDRGFPRSAIRALPYSQRREILSYFEGIGKNADWYIVSTEFLGRLRNDQLAGMGLRAVAEGTGGSTQVWHRGYQGARERLAVTS